MYLVEENGKRRRYKAPLLKTVRDIKSDIIKKFKIPKRLQKRKLPWKLKCNDRWLDDDSSIRDAGVVDGDELRVGLRMDFFYALLAERMPGTANLGSDNMGLDSDNWQRAAEELLQLGPYAQRYLERARNSDNWLVRRRAETIILTLQETSQHKMSGK